MKLEPYKPKTPARFWCNQCDEVVVDSQLPHTGDFFVVFGHSYDDTLKSYEGNYVDVMFAFCSTCKEK